MAKKKAALVVAYDDGAGDGKYIAYRDGKEVLRFKIRSLVSNGTYDAMGFSGRTTTIELPSTKSDKVFEPGMLFSVGEHLSSFPNIQPEITDSRYTSQAALIRFYAGLGRMIEELQLEMPLTIDLRLGLSTQSYTTYKDAVREFFLGDHYFRYCGTEMRVIVDTVTVHPQAYLAANAVLQNPPPAMADMLKEYPFEDNRTVILDIGNFTTDAAVLQGDGERVTPIDFFAIRLGVSDVLRELSSAINRQHHYIPTHRDLIRAITPTDKGYKTIKNRIAGQGALNVGPIVDSVAKAIWGDIFAQTARQVRDFTGSYVIFTGGGSLIFRDYILQTALVGKTKVAEYPGAVLTGSEWKVAEGM